MLVPLHFANLLFSLQQGGRTPALVLITRAAARDAMRCRLDAGHYTLDQVRRLDADAEVREHLRRSRVSMSSRPSSRRLNTALDQPPQEGGAPPLVLGGGLCEARDPLLPRRGDGERDDHLIVGERLPVQEEHQPLGVVMSPLMERMPRRRPGAHEAPRHAPRGQSERLRLGVGGRFVVAARQRPAGRRDAGGRQVNALRRR